MTDKSDNSNQSVPSIVEDHHAPFIFFDEALNKAIRSLLLIIVIWATTTAWALGALLQGSAVSAKVALCWQIALLPGGIASEIIRRRNEWRQDANDLASSYEAMPIVVSGVIALVVAYFIF